MKLIPLALGIVYGAVLLFAQNPWVYRDHPRWDRSWNQRPLPRSGACFFVSGRASLKMLDFRETVSV